MSKFMNAAVPRPMAGWVEVEEAMGFVVKTLSQSPYLLGDKFSGADVLYGTTLGMFGQSPMMPKSDVVTDYVKRCLDRPAYARALEKDAA
jgi:glutathione S-transferase